ncbi:hypothetical protein KCP69_01520 [Salmonella enterica subsp. enterica]|nr:hypothetical protein KCP69_01520 [Salmonella enterica subsp. enterica]
MPPLFTINACKSAGCRNLGLPDSWRIMCGRTIARSYPALHCRACGSYPPRSSTRGISPLGSTYRAICQEHGRTARLLSKHGFAMDVIPAERSDFSASTVRKSGRQKARAEY